MQHLVPFTALLFLLSVHPTATRVVVELQRCNRFFLEETPPEIQGILAAGNIGDQNRYKVICQTRTDTETFVTLYDTRHKIPVFSAYRYRGGGRDGRRIWTIEPQLENLNNNPNMEKERQGTEYRQQAVLDNYIEHDLYNRGHLLPFSYGHTANEKTSTCSLTNIVPQVIRFNGVTWNNMERCVKCVMDNYCINNNGQTEGYVVIGAKPGNTLHNGINVPSVLWSALCCYSRERGKWFAGAHWAENVEPTSGYLYTRTLESLRTELGEQPFPQRSCRDATSFSEVYPELRPQPDCHCPPPEPQEGLWKWMVEGLWDSIKSNSVVNFTVQTWNNIRARVVEFTSQLWNRQ